MSIRKRILRIHGTFLIVAGVTLAINSTIGTFAGFGPLKFLQDEPFGLVGLFQAYLLIAIIGMVLWMGSAGENIRKWHLVGALAHIPPLTMVIVFWDLFATVDMTPIAVGSLVFHVTFIVIETTAFVYKSSSTSL